LGETIETLRWPGNLDHAAIVAKLVEIRETAKKAGHGELASRLADVETTSAAHLGPQVIGTLIWIQEKPEYDAYTTPLGIVAMNLKNLKQPAKD
jgi:hypothetical protein